MIDPWAQRLISESVGGIVDESDGTVCDTGHAEMLRGRRLPARRSSKNVASMHLLCRCGSRHCRSARVRLEHKFFGPNADRQRVPAALAWPPTSSKRSRREVTARRGGGLSVERTTARPNANRRRPSGPPPAKSRQGNLPGSRPPGLPGRRRGRWRSRRCPWPERWRRRARAG
jgi:hypothetical protein